MKVIILAAGTGSRLGYNIPKSLVQLDGNTTILDHQINSLKKYITSSDFIIVAGYKKDLIIQQYHVYRYAINDSYKSTNTSKSLLKGLELLDTEEDFIYINGDVVFDPEIIGLILSARDKNLICVNNEKVAEEEVKYNLDCYGYIKNLSKQVKNPLGEAIGINYINSNYMQVIVECLRQCSDQDYHEKAIELAIGKGIKFSPLSIGSRFSIEIDFEEDLKEAKKIFNGLNNA